MLVINPYKTLTSINDMSTRECGEWCHNGTGPSHWLNLPLAPSIQTCCSDLPPMHHTKQPKSIMTLSISPYFVVLSLLTVLSSSGMTGSRETHPLHLPADQVLWLSSHSKKEPRMASQVKALYTLLNTLQKLAQFCITAYSLFQTSSQ